MQLTVLLCFAISVRVGHWFHTLLLLIFSLTYPAICIYTGMNAGTPSSTLCIMKQLNSLLKQPTGHRASRCQVRNLTSNSCEHRLTSTYILEKSSISY